VYTQILQTHSGVIGMEVDKTTVAENISEKLSAQKNMKIGIISSVTINHATPAAFYSHVPSRNEYYDIAMQMANSNFDYFAGGTISSNTGKDGTDKDVFEVLTEKGYTIADTADEINALNSNSGKVYAVSPVLQDSGAMPYTLDSDESTVSLTDFVDKGIEVLDNSKSISAEILHTFVGCIGLILVCPLTAAVSSWVYTKRKITCSE
jgi:alkaline phosphatase